jgi:hypothetical protein
MVVIETQKASMKNSVPRQWTRDFDIILALKGQGFLLQDGDVPPRGYCELH